MIFNLGALLGIVNEFQLFSENLIIKYKVELDPLSYLHTTLCVYVCTAPPVGYQPFPGGLPALAHSA